MSSPSETSSSLRERRRRETAGEIQRATLHLILTHGFSQVTTDMIAQEAGVSTRTFFNYYPNKEAAAVGVEPQFSAEGLQHFHRGEGDLATDLGLLMHDILSSGRGQKELIRIICAVVDINPALLPAFQSNMQKTIATVAEGLRKRDPHLSEERARLMAEVFSVVLGHTVRRWSEEEGGDLAAAVQELTDTLRVIGTMMAAPRRAIP